MTVERPAQKQLAENPEMLYIQLRNQLSKFGQTEFEATMPQILLPHPWFVPVSLLGDMRREATGRLQELRSAWRPADVFCKETDMPYPFERDDRHLDYRANVMNIKAKEFYMEHGAATVDWAMEHPEHAAEEIRMLMQCRYCLLDALGACKKNKSGNSLQYHEPLYLQHGSLRYKLQFDCSACEMYVISEPK